MSEVVPEPGPSAPGKPPSFWQGFREHPLLKRLPLLILVSVAVLFLLPNMPHEVELDYRFGSHAAGLQGADLELRTEKGDAVRRSVRTYPGPVTHETQHLHLPKGRYQVRATLRYPDHTERIERSAVVDKEPVVEIDLSGP